MWLMGLHTRYLESPIGDPCEYFCVCSSVTDWPRFLGHGAAGTPIHALFCAINMITWAVVLIVQCTDDSLVLQLCIFLKSRCGGGSDNSLASLKSDFCLFIVSPQVT